jgi:hypothetical protein
MAGKSFAKYVVLHRKVCGPVKTGEPKIVLDGDQLANQFLQLGRHVCHLIFCCTQAAS